MLRKRAEDYLEAIYELCRNKGFTRVKEIADYLNVKPATVSEMLNKLSREGYIIYRKRLFVTLTESGIKITEEIRERRETLIKFLTALGVPKDVAERDACTIEHVLHDITVNQLKMFVKFIESSPIYPRWLEHFEEFCRTSKHPCMFLQSNLKFPNVRNI